MKYNAPTPTKKERNAIAAECERQFDDFCFLGERRNEG